MKLSKKKIRCTVINNNETSHVNKLGNYKENVFKEIQHKEEKNTLYLVLDLLCYILYF